jgi:ribosomal protein S18 acetylase RimI-like enzyme
MEVVDLNGGRRGATAEVLTEAFLDDPAWLAIGPRRAPHRRRVLRSYHGLALREALRHGGPSWCATREGSVVGCAVTFADGTAYPPPRATLVEGRAFALAGPGPSLRGARVDAALKRAHPEEPHLYLWFLAAHPSAQRQGVGRALLERVLEEASERETPAYLETTKPENVPYYASFGFGVIGEADLPRGAHAWFMWRDARPAAARPLR